MTSEKKLKSYNFKKFFLRVLLTSLLVPIFVCWALYDANRVTSGQNVDWQDIGSPPGVPQKILEVYPTVWIKTTTSDIYYYEETTVCENNKCWQVAEWVSSETLPGPLTDVELAPFDECGYYPNFPDSIDYKASCLLHDSVGFWNELNVAAIGANAHVYVWSDSDAEGDSMQTFFSLAAAIYYGCPGSLVILLFLYVVDWVKIFRIKRLKEH